MRILLYSALFSVLSLLAHAFFYNSTIGYKVTDSREVELADNDKPIADKRFYSKEELFKLKAEREARLAEDLKVLKSQPNKRSEIRRQYAKEKSLLFSWIPWVLLAYLLRRIAIRRFLIVYTFPALLFLIGLFSPAELALVVGISLLFKWIMMRYPTRQDKQRV